MANYRVTYKCGYVTDVRTINIPSPTESAIIQKLVSQGSIKPEYARDTIVLRVEAL
jgi:hypothetical protein